MGLADQIGGWDEDGAAPLYRRLQGALRDAIADRRLRPHQALPPERELASDLSVSRVTVRKALDGLVDEGLLHRRQGAGTFVAGRVEKQFAKLSSFSEDMAARGRRSHSRWLSRHEGAVNPDEALTLGLSPGTAVYRFERIRYADDLAMAIERSTIPAIGLASVDAVDISLYAALEATGMRPVRALQRLRAVLFDDAQAELLGIAAASPGLFIERRGFLDDGRVIEMTQSWYRGDAYDFVAELTTGD